MYSKTVISDIQKELYMKDDEGRAYLEYNGKVGGDPIGLTVPYGYPKGVIELGGVIAVYQECIRQHITWQELLDFNNVIHDDLI